MSRLVNSGILKFKTKPYLIAGVYSSNQSLKSYLYITRDLGASWQIIFSQYQSWGVVKTSSNGQHIFAGCVWGLAWISHNGGMSWIQIFGTSNRSYIQCQISDDGLMIVATHNSTNVVLSLDGGLTYTQTVVATGTHQSVALSGDKSMMLVTVNKIIYVSYNQGSSWAVYDPMGLGATNWVGVGLSRDGSVIYLLRQQLNGIYVSTNGGVNWNNPTNFNYPTGFMDLTPDGKRALFANSTSYITYTDDFGASHQNISINAISSPTINGSGSLIIISQEETQPTEMIRRNDGAGGITLTQMYDSTNTIVGFRQTDYRRHALAQPKL